MKISGGDDVGLLEMPARRLSLGQQQRLSLARLILDRAPFVILDEPLAGIDVFTVREIVPALVQYLCDSQRTVLLISHRLAFVSHATHVIVMSETGAIVEEGVPRDLLCSSSTVLSQLHQTALAELGYATSQV